MSGLVLISPALTAWRWSRDWRARVGRTTSPHSYQAGDIDGARDSGGRTPCSMRSAKPRSPVTCGMALNRFAGRQWLGDDQRRELPDAERLHALSTRRPAQRRRDADDMCLIADVIAAAAPDVERIDFPDAGHMLHWERPADVAAAITGSSHAVDSPDLRDAAGSQARAPAPQGIKMDSPQRSLEEAGDRI